VLQEEINKQFPRKKLSFTAMPFEFWPLTLNELASLVSANEARLLNRICNGEFEGKWPRLNEQGRKELMNLRRKIMLYCDKKEYEALTRSFFQRKGMHQLRQDLYKPIVVFLPLYAIRKLGFKLPSIG
jgi:hypothetical protein